MKLYYFEQINKRFDEILEKLDRLDDKLDILDKLNNPEDVVFVLKGYGSESSKFWDEIKEQKFIELVGID